MHTKDIGFQDYVGDGRNRVSLRFVADTPARTLDNSPKLNTGPLGNGAGNAT